MSTLWGIPVRRLVVAANGALGCVMLLVAGTAPVLHRWTVTAPAERHFASGIEEVLKAERAALARHGRFVPFASAPGAIQRALPAANPGALRGDLFAYRAAVTPDGILTLTAWTRQDAVLQQGTPPLAAVYELSAQGKVLRRDQASTQDQDR